jgi:hypothetical protein
VFQARQREGMSRVTITFGNDNTGQERHDEAQEFL